MRYCLSPLPSRGGPFLKLRSVCCRLEKGIGVPPPPPPTFTQLWRLFFSKKLSKTHFYSLEKCIFDDVLEKYCCWLTVCRSCCPHPPPFPPSPSLALPPHLRPWTSLTLPPPHFLQPCGLCMGGSLCCQFLALPHPHPPLRTFRSCSFQKNYLKRTFAASKSAFSIMSYESITAGCLFAGRACSTHPPSPPVPPRLRPCTLLTLPPPHSLQPCGLCMGGSLCCQFLALPHPHPPLRSFGGCSFPKNYLKRIFTASKSAFSMMS